MRVATHGEIGTEGGVFPAIFSVLGANRGRCSAVVRDIALAASEKWTIGYLISLPDAKTPVTLAGTIFFQVGGA